MLANPEVVKSDVVKWIKSYFDSVGESKIVIEASPDPNSMVTTFLCAEAVGADNIIPVVTADYAKLDLDMLNALGQIGLQSAVYWVKPQKVKLAMAEELRIFRSWSYNKDEFMRKADILMISCFAKAKNALVASPRDMTGEFIGACELHGDFAPLADFTAGEVMQLGIELGVQDTLLRESKLLYKDKLVGFNAKQVEDYIGTGSSGTPGVDFSIAAAHNASLRATKRIPRFYMPQTTDYSTWTDEMKSAYQIYMENHL